MCIGTPMELREIKGDTGVVELGGTTKEVSLELIEEPKVGDYLIIHAGYAIQKIDKAAADKTIADFRRFG